MATPDALLVGRTQSYSADLRPRRCRELAAYIAQWMVGTALQERGAAFDMVYERGDVAFVLELEARCVPVVQRLVREVDLQIGPHGYKLVLQEMDYICKQ